MTALNLLIVDDEENIVHSLARSLRDPFTVFTATSGAAALNILAKETIDIILTDQRMPEMTGVELLAAAKNICPTAVGIIVTAYTDVEALIAAVNLNNVRGYVAKPWNIQLLRQVLLETALQQSQHFIEQVLETTPSGIYIYDAVEQRNVYANHSVTAILGYTSQAILQFDGALLRHLIHPDDLERLDEHLMRAASTGGDVFQIQCRLKRANGEWCWLHAWETRLVRSSTGKPKLILGAFHEITEHKNVEQALKQAYQREKELSDLRSRLATTINHEFRTPLSIIQSAVEGLTIYGDRMTDEQKTVRAQRVSSQIFHMTRLLDQSMYVEQFESGAVDFNPEVLDLDTLFQGLADEFRISWLEHPLVYNKAADIGNATVDRQLVRQIVLSLLDNAAKYSPAGSAVVLTLTSQGQSIIIQVQDEGVGIPEQDSAHLFEPYYRASNVSTVPGIGTGLFIAKHAIGLHNGTISVVSKSGKGVLVTVEIPQFCQEKN